MQELVFPETPNHDHPFFPLESLPRMDFEPNLFYHRLQVRSVSAVFPLSSDTLSFRATILLCPPNVFPVPYSLVFANFTALYLKSFLGTVMVKS